MRLLFGMGVRLYRGHLRWCWHEGLRAYSRPRRLLLLPWALHLGNNGPLRSARTRNAELRHGRSHDSTAQGQTSSIFTGVPHPQRLALEAGTAGMGRVSYSKRRASRVSMREALQAGMTPNVMPTTRAIRNAGPKIQPGARMSNEG